MKLHKQAYFSREQTKQLLNRLKREKRFDLVLCNDVQNLPLAAELAASSKAKLYLDAHEYTPRQFVGNRALEEEEYWSSLINTYAARVDLMTSVCDRITFEYSTNFGLKCTSPVFNVPPYDATLLPCKSERETVRFVHCGLAIPNRNLENMIELVRSLNSRFSLTFFLVADRHGAYLEKLRQLASDCDRIHFRNAVPQDELVREINQFDLGLYLLKPDTFNQRYALPNKFFEFTQARLGIAVWPSPEMKSFVERYNLGVVSDDFTVKSMIAALKGLTNSNINEYKRNSHNIAREFSSIESTRAIRENVRLLIGEE